MPGVGPLAKPDIVPISGRKSASDPAAIKLMLVDDSLVIRSIIEQMVGDDARFEIVASVDNGRKAIDYLRHHRADIIILDIEMPVMDGLAALPEIIAHGQDARVLILSSNGEAGGEAAIKALALGASDTLAKPGRTNFGGKFRDILLERLVHLGDSQASVPKASHYVDTFQGGTSQPALAIPASPLQAIAIGASTGGISAAIELIERLSNSYTGPLFYTQHLPDNFIPYFAGQLRASTKRAVKVAEEGDRIADNCIYLAPGTGHLTIVRSGASELVIEICEAAAPSGCEPSTDPMFASIADIYGGGACAILLSGMGNDGLIGARALAAAKAQILAQSPDTCVVWGMPGSVVRDGIACAVLNPEGMADFINLWAGEGA